MFSNSDRNLNFDRSHACKQKFTLDRLVVISFVDIINMEQNSKSSPKKSQELHPLESLFKRHISKQWPCSVCNQDFAQYKDLYLHMEKNEHVNVEPTQELKHFYKKMASKKNLKRKNPFTESRKKFAVGRKQRKEERKELSVIISPTKSPVAPKAKQEKKKEELSVVTISVNCHICSKEVPNLNLLNDHLLKDHQIENIRCYVPNCCASYSHINALFVHLKKHKPTDFVCFDCPVLGPFENNFVLKEHLKQTHWSGRFQCSKCTFPESSTRQLIQNHINKDHLKQVAGGQSFPIKATTPPSYNQPQPHAIFITVAIDCFLCNEILDTAEELNDHLLKVHGHKQALCIVPGCWASYDDW